MREVPLSFIGNIGAHTHQVIEKLREADDNIREKLAFDDDDDEDCWRILSFWVGMLESCISNSLIRIGVLVRYRPNVRPYQSPIVWVNTIIDQPVQADTS